MSSTRWFLSLLTWGCIASFQVTATQALNPNPLPENSPLQAIIDHHPEQVMRLLDAIDWDYDGLGAGKTAWKQGKPRLALELLLQHMRSKPLPDALTPGLPPARADIIALADDATRRIFTIQSRTYEQPTHPDGRINWEDQGPNQDKEWAWMLNRHPHFPFLLSAFQHTKDPAYLTTLSAPRTGWIPDHPPPNRVSFSTSWRALEAARRIVDSWLPVYAHVRSEPGLSNEALFWMLSAIPEHADYLRNHYSFWGGNHKMTEKMAIATCALAWPEFKASVQWLVHAVSEIREELFKQTYADGSYKELANHYQKVVAENYLRMLRMLESRGKDKVDRAFRERVEALWQNLAVVMRPSGMGPLNSDSSLENNRHLVSEANRYFQRMDWEFILSHGASGVAPIGLPTQFFPWAGHAIMRSGWGEKDHWAFFDIGPHGSAHQHWDRLHLSISLGQQDLLVDSGRYIYKPGALRDYFRFGMGHNVVRVDGKDSRRPPNSVREPMPVLSQIEPAFDAFAARVDFHLGMPAQKKVQHHRIVVYLRGTGWLVIDELIGYGAHRYETLWNLHPDNGVRVDGTALHVELPGDWEASLALLNPQSGGGWDLAHGQLSPEVRGWYSWGYNERLASHSARYHYPASQPHINVWWIAPRSTPAADQAPTARLLKPVRHLSDLQVEIQAASNSGRIDWVDGRIVFTPSEEQ